MSQLTAIPMEGNLKRLYVMRRTGVGHIMRNNRQKFTTSIAILINMQEGVPEAGLDCWLVCILSRAAWRAEAYY